MKTQNPALILDNVTARKNKGRLDNREPIELDTRGAVGSIVVHLATQAVAQALQGDAAKIAVSSFLEGRGGAKDEAWKIHVTDMEFDAEAQTLKITRLELRPVK